MTLPTPSQLEYMLSNATDGPWDVQWDDDEGTNEIVKNMYGGGSVFVGHSRSDHNAALIALAPELAAQHILNLCRIAEHEAEIVALHEEAAGEDV